MKYYILLFLIAGIALFYVFLQDPCNRTVKTDFSNRYPSYNILDSAARDGTPESVHCHVYYQKPDSELVYEDIWLYENSVTGWGFSGILETRETQLTP